MADILNDVFDKSAGQKKVTFQQKKPLLNYELNLAQDIIKSETEDFNRLGLGSNYSGESFTVDTGTLANEVFVKEGVLYQDGQEIVLTNTKTVAVPAQPGSGTRQDTFYLEWSLENVESTPDPAIGFATTFQEVLDFEFKVSEGTSPVASDETITFSGNTVTLTQGEFPDWLKLTGTVFTTNSTDNAGSPSYTVTNSPDDQTIEVAETFVGELSNNVTFYEYDPSGDIAKKFKAYRRNFYQLAYLNRTAGFANVDDIEDIRDKVVYNYVKSGYEVTASTGLQVDVSDGEALVADEEVLSLATSVTLTDNATNYVYAGASGLVSFATTQPTDFHLMLAEVRTKTGAIISVSDERSFQPVVWANKKVVQLSDDTIAALAGIPNTVLDPEIIPPSDLNRFVTQSKQFAVSETIFTEVTVPATIVTMTYPIDGAPYLGIESDADSALKYFDLLNLDERRPALYTDTGSNLVQIVGIWKDAGLTIPIDPSVDTIQDVDPTGFWEGGTLYFELDGTVDSDFNLSYLKRYDLKDIPVDAMARGVGTGGEGGGVATSLVDGGEPARWDEDSVEGIASGTTVTFPNKVYTFGSDEAMFYRNGIRMDKVGVFSGTKATAYQEVNNGANSNQITLDSSFPTTATDIWQMYVFVPNVPGNIITGTGTAGTAADAKEDKIEYTTGSTSSVVFPSEVWDDSYRDSLIIYRNGALMREIGGPFSGTDANVYIPVNGGASSNTISIDPAIPAVSGDIIQMFYVVPNVPTVETTTPTGTVLDFEIESVTGITGDTITFPSNFSTNNTLQFYRNDVLMIEVDNFDGTNANVYSPSFLGSTNQIDLDVAFLAVSTDVWTRIEFIKNTPTQTAGAGWELIGNTLVGGEKFGALNDVPFEIIKNDETHIRFDDFFDDVEGETLKTVQITKTLLIDSSSAGVAAAIYTEDEESLGAEDQEVGFSAVGLSASGAAYFDGGSYRNQDGPTTGFFGSAHLIDDGGFYKGGNTFFEGSNWDGDPGDNGDFQSGDVFIRSGDSFSSLGSDINSGNVVISTGLPANAGTRGDMFIDTDNLFFTANTADFTGVTSVIGLPMNWADPVDANILPDTPTSSTFRFIGSAANPFGTVSSTQLSLITGGSGNSIGRLAAADGVTEIVQLRSLGIAEMQIETSSADFKVLAFGGSLLLQADNGIDIGTTGASNVDFTGVTGSLDLTGVPIDGASINNPFHTAATTIDTRESSLLSSTVAGGGTTNLTLSNAQNGTNFTLYIENTGGTDQTVNLTVTGYTLKWPSGTAITNVPAGNITAWTIVCTNDLSTPTAIVTGIEDFS